MNIQSQHHFDFRREFKATCEGVELSNSETQPSYWKEIPFRKAVYHFEIYADSQFPTKVKLVHAEDVGNNQACSCYGQIIQLLDKGDRVLFVFRGNGWKKGSHRAILNKLRVRLGQENVIHIRELKTWIELNINQKESR